MFWNRDKVRANVNETSSLAYSNYSLLKPEGYKIPEEMLKEIEREVEKVTIDSIEHNLIDEFTPEEMQNDNPGELHFLRIFLHNCLEKALIELQKQKIMIDSGIEEIKMLQEVELMRHKRALEFAKKELERCDVILRKVNNSKLHI